MISGPIFQALRGLVDNRCYPSTFPQPPAVPAWPAIRYTISHDANPVLCGTDDGTTDNFTVQFDVVALTYGAAKTLRDQVVATLETLTPPAVREFENETYDTETKTHRVILAYSLHPSSPATP